MVELLRGWIMSITVVALIGAVLNQFVPEGALKRGFNLTLGVALTVCIISPVRNVTYSEMLYFDTMYNRDFSEKTQRLTQANQNWQEQIIKERVQAYILQKAGELGLDCGVEVSVAQSDTGMLLPYSAEVIYIGDPAPSVIEQFKEFLAVECGVPKERQGWYRRGIDNG